MTTVNLAYLVKPTRGGWPTYTAHLAHGLQAAGHHVQLWRVGRRTENGERPFGRGLRYRNATAEYLAELARHEKMHIVAAEPSVADTVKLLLAAGATITIHDPTELKGGMPEALEAGKEPIVVIRRSVMHHYHQNVGKQDIRFVPHPYLRMPTPLAKARPPYHAVAYSRLDWDKGTHHIVEANKHIDKKYAVHMYGAENRLYTHHKLEDIDKDWRRYYHGQWAVDDLWGGVKIARRGRLAVDLSAIKGDGGGTQYTFLEAIDAGTTLVLNRAWLKLEAGTNDMLEAAVFVEPEHLRETLEDNLPRLEPGKLLERHNAKKCALETVGLA